ncbi:MAG: hypothetical protein OXH14_09810, partial [Alphaproteobacteria bacterium]|nr:hypothetical protein [Alphaproteobacteria bacterium]
SAPRPALAGSVLHGAAAVSGVNGKTIGNGHAGIVTSRIQSIYWSERAAGWHGVKPADILAN